MVSKQALFRQWIELCMILNVSHDNLMYVEAKCLSAEYQKLKAKAIRECLQGWLKTPAEFTNFT